MIRVDGDGGKRLDHPGSVGAAITRPARRGSPARSSQWWAGGATKGVSGGVARGRRQGWPRTKSTAPWRRPRPVGAGPPGHHLGLGARDIGLPHL
jgi:hypothetical protein